MKLVGKMRKTKGHIIGAFAVLRKPAPAINQSLSKCIECIFDHWTATVNHSVKCPFIIMLGIAQDCFIHGDGWVGGYEEVGFIHRLLRLLTNTMLLCYASVSRVCYVH